MNTTVIFNRNDNVPHMYDTVSNYDKETGGHLIDFDRMISFVYHHPKYGINAELMHAFYAVQLFLKFGNPERAKNAHQAILNQNKEIRDKYGVRPFITAFIPYTPDNAKRMCDAVRECWDALYDPNNNGGNDSFLEMHFERYF